MAYSGKNTLRWLALLAMCAASGSVELLRHSALHSLANADFWMHLRIGQDMLRLHTLPHTGWASQLGTQPWVDATWLFDVMVAVFYRVLDVRVVLVAAIIARCFVAAAIFLAAGGLRGRCWPAFLLSLLGQLILSGIQPLPVVCSIVAFAIELAVLREYRATRDVRWLYALPALFLLWANFDYNVVIGIATLILFFADEQLSRNADRRMALTLLGALLASLLTPYGWSPYGVFFGELTSAAGQYFPDHLAMRFRSPQDYLLLLLGMAAFLALGMRRSRKVFFIVLLLGTTAAAFCAQRNGWLLVCAAAAIIGESWDGAQATEVRQAWLLPLAVAAAAFLLSIAVVLRNDRSRVWEELAQTYPVHAADEIRAHPAQPIFNSIEFGGFLAWYLPDLPVAIDGRPGLYDDDFEIHYAKVMNAEEHFSTLSPLMQAQYLLLSKSSMMATALATVPSFKTVYSDDVAVVLERNPAAP